MEDAKASDARLGRLWIEKPVAMTALLRLNFVPVSPAVTLFVSQLTGKPLFFPVAVKPLCRSLRLSKMLTPAGLGLPSLRALIPNEDNYSVLLYAASGPN